MWPERREGRIVGNKVEDVMRGWLVVSFLVQWKGFGVHTKQGGGSLESSK